MPYTFHRRTLPNGLTVIAEVSPSAHTAAAGFFVKTGARDESGEVMGVSHFLEHMMFKGTEGLTAEELNRAFDEIGARNNAFTSNEMTCFYAHSLPEHLPRTIELLSRMMRPSLNQSDFDTEKGVILEEIAMYKDNPFFVLYEASIEKHFGAHPLSHRVLGTTESITALRSDQMRGYFNNRYSADNTILALSGRLDFDAVCDQVGALCGTWTPTCVSRDNSPPPLAGGEFILQNEKVTRAYLLAMCPAPAVDDDRRYAAALLAQVLGAPDNSRLHWALIEPGIAEECQASFDPHDGFGEFFVFASGEPARLDEIWSIIRRELANLIASLAQDDLERLRNKLITGATVGGERPQDRMHRLGRLWTYLSRYSSLEEELDRLAAVTLDDLRAVHDAFPLKPVTVGRLLPA
ncbi:mitochondrial-processing peptidase subunit beta [Phycisphaerales bacterium]|nr:mitochondrial-processing peptidase subunit beta [Phycisphaerales bacterium]